MFYTWLHLIALTVYLGAVVGLWLMLLPAAATLEKHEEKLSFLARSLKFYNPIQIGSLGIILFTGAFQLTELKAVYRDTFIQQVAYPLSVKLVFAFLLVILSVYQALGIGHRFVRRHEGGGAISRAELEGIVRRIKGVHWGILLIAAVTVWMGLRLGS